MGILRYKLQQIFNFYSQFVDLTHRASRDVPSSAYASVHSVAMTPDKHHTIRPAPGLPAFSYTPELKKLLAKS